jgi:probable HAF family extracellular repeat protein
MPPGASAFKAKAINDLGIIVGTANLPDLGYRGYVLTEGVYRYVQPLAGAQWSSANAVNLSGEVVGDSTNVFVGPIWAIQLNGDQTEALELAGAENSSAAAVNNLGWIAGWAGETPDSSAAGFLLRDGSVTELGFLPGGAVTHPLSMNNAGVVVGRATVRVGNSTDSHAFLWDGQSINDLGTLPDFRHSFAYGASDERTVIGFCRSIPGNLNAERAFIWCRNMMHDLTNLVEEPSGLAVRRAHSINAAGQIIGIGGSVDGILLTPRPAITADLDLNGEVGLSDLAILLSDFGCGESNCPGDVDGDGATTLQDLAMLLSRFGQRCP